MKLRNFLILAVILILSVGAFAQAPDTLPNNLYAVGGSANPGGSPQFAGTGLYAKRVVDSGTYAFTIIDALPTSRKPFTVNTNIGAGVAQKAFSINKINIFVTSSAGISYSGKNTGWAGTAGGAAVIPLKKNFFLLPNVRVVKSSVSNDSGYQLIGGLMLGWGK